MEARIPRRPSGTIVTSLGFLVMGNEKEHVENKAALEKNLWPKGFHEPQKSLVGNPISRKIILSAGKLKD